GGAAARRETTRTLPRVRGRAASRMRARAAARRVRRPRDDFAGGLRPGGRVPSPPPEEPAAPTPGKRDA
ncbi:hypothetical protein AB0K34_34090, partial [Actinomadura sp. NPDC049382]